MLGIANAEAIGDAYQATARLYHQGEVRWVSPDPAGLGAVDLSNPQTMNRYAYVANNPLSNTDPSGLFVQPPGQPNCSYTESDGSGPCTAFGYNPYTPCGFLTGVFGGGPAPGCTIGTQYFFAGTPLVGSSGSSASNNGRNWLGSPRQAA